MTRIFRNPSRCFTRLVPLLFLFTMTLFPGCKNHEQAAAPAPHPPMISVVTITPRDVPVSFEYVANTQSSHMVNINARVSGFLDKRVYTEGALVKEGQVLFQMDPKPFQVQLAQAEAALSMQAANLETARSNLIRIKPLTEQNALSQKDLDDAKGQFESASASVEQAKAQVETARLNLSYTTITSPVTGLAAAAIQTDGTYISTQNSQLTTVSVLSPIWVNFSISENEMQAFHNQITQGLIIPPPHQDYLVDIILVDGSTFPYTGRITFAEPSYNSQTGTFLLRVSVNNPKYHLRPNQFVRVRLKGAIRPKAILLPQRAVQQGAKGHFVWVIRNNKAEARPVVVGDWFGDDWFISEGLRAGEMVATDGTMMLRPGMTVAIKSGDAPKTPPEKGDKPSDPSSANGKK